MIHLEFINLFIPKSILDAKYSGGLAQYRLDRYVCELTEGRRKFNSIWGDELESH